MAQKGHKKKSNPLPRRSKSPSNLSNGADITTGLIPFFRDFMFISLLRKYKKCVFVCFLDDKQLVSLAEACWSKVVSERQHILEESYKVEISASSTTETKPVSMTEISPLWEEMAHKAWQLYTGKLTFCRQHRG